MNLNTRIILKNDDLAKWNASSIQLKEGEVALAKVTVNSKDPITGNTVPVPTYLMKVGDGSTAFSSLNWVTAPAADVYDWAKAAEKPTYEVKEISGLEDYISGIDTDTQYRIVEYEITTEDGTEKGYKLESKAKNGTTWTEVSDSIKINWYTTTDIDSKIATNLETAKGYADSIKTEILGNNVEDTYDTLKAIDTWITTHSVEAEQLEEALGDEVALREEQDTVTLAAANQKAAELAEAAKNAAIAYADELNHEDTTYDVKTDGGLKLNADNTFAINDEIEFIFNCGDSSERE